MTFGGPWTGLFQVRPCIFQQVSEFVLIMQLQWHVDQIILSGWSEGTSNQAARGRSQAPRWCGINPRGRPPALSTTDLIIARGGERTAEEALRGSKDMCAALSAAQACPCRCALNPTACLRRKKERPHTLHKRKKAIYSGSTFMHRLWTSPNELTKKEAISITIAWAFFRLKVPSKHVENCWISVWEHLQETLQSTDHLFAERPAWKHTLLCWIWGQVRFSSPTDGGRSRSQQCCCPRPPDSHRTRRGCVHGLPPTRRESRSGAPWMHMSFIIW